MIFKDLNEFEAKEIIRGFKAKFVHSDNVTVQYMEIKSGSRAPEHSHPNEQISSLISGEFELTVDGQTKTMKPGMVAVIPPNVKHSGVCKKDSKMIDIFYPTREDFT
jgi:quercetin dioxygenase-like cupin family protein